MKFSQTVVKDGKSNHREVFTMQTILKQIIAYQYDKMNEDILKVVGSLGRNGDTSKRSIRMATMCVVSIYDAEMGYINIKWDEGKTWWVNNYIEFLYKKWNDCGLFTECVDECENYPQFEKWWYDEFLDRLPTEDSDNDNDENSQECDDYCDITKLYTVI